jgi:hypothetical protein
MERSLENPDYLADLRSDLSNVAIGDKWGANESSVRRDKKKLMGQADHVAPFTQPTGESEQHNPDGSSSYVRFSTEPWGFDDYREFIRATGQDPDRTTFTWGWTSAPSGGFWNKINNVRPIANDDTAPAFDLDPVGILANLRANHAPATPVHVDHGGATSTFVISLNDIQLGQSYNGGSDATIARFHEFVTLASKRVHELRKIGRNLERLVVICGGDLVEGCFIYPHQMRNIDLNRKQQQQGVIALLLHTLDTLAPLFETVTVLATKGNHGEHREGGKKIDLSDNDDILCVEMAKLALARDASMRHIDWIIADEEAAVWAPVYDWTLVTTHGDIYAKGVSGATTERKAHAWMKNMAAAFRKFGRIGRADVLITHHFHHDEMADWGDTLWRQTTSQDRGSPEFSQATGQYSEPGMLTAVMTPTSRWQDEAVLR